QRETHRPRVPQYGQAGNELPVIRTRAPKPRGIAAILCGSLKPHAKNIRRRGSGLEKHPNVSFHFSLVLLRYFEPSLQLARKWAGYLKSSKRGSVSRSTG